MIIPKRRLSTLVIAFAVIAILTSCGNNATNVPLPTDQTTFEQPVSQPLNLSKPVKFDWKGIKGIIVKPDVEKFSIDGLPSHTYDSLLFKPFSKPVTEQKFDYNSLPSKPLDIDKLPSKPLTYKTYLLAPPKLISTGMPGLKDPANPSVYTLGDIAGVGGSIKYFLKDHNGFFWILTDQNLYRYDGENLLLYLKVETTTQSNQFIMEDDQGRIWINEFNAIEILDPKKGIITSTDAGNANGDIIIKTYEDDRQRIWVGFFSGNINIIDLKTGTIKYMDARQGMISKIPYGFTMDNNNRLWITTIGGGVEIIDQQHKNIRYFNKNAGLTQDSISATLKDANGCIWMAGMGHNHGSIIYIADPAKGTLQQIDECSSSQVFIPHLSKDDEGDVWASTSNGVSVFDLANRKLRYLYVGNGLTDNNIQNIEQDKAGQMWVAGSKGISIISHDSHIVQHIGNTATTSLYQDDQGFLWQESPFDGLNIIDPVHKTFRHLDQVNGISSDTLQSVKVINGQIFLCTDAGVDLIDPVRKTIAHFTPKQGFIELPSLVFVDNAGRIWLGGNNVGLDVYDPKTNVLKYIGEKQGFTDNSIIDMTQDELGRIWSSTFKGGVRVIDLKKQTIANLNNVQGLNTYPKSFTKDNHGNIWMSSEKGVFVIDLKNNKLLSLSAAYGNKTVFNILQHNGRIYTAGYNGINLITPPAGGIGTGGKWQIGSYGIAKVNKRFFQTDAMAHNGYYLWGDAGITVLDLAKKENYTPDVFVSGISVMDTPKFFTAKYQFKATDTLWNANGDNYITGDKQIEKFNRLKNTVSYDSIAGPYNMPVNLRLPYNKNYLSFSFGSFGKAEPDSALYQYLLAGADTKWSGVTTLTTSRTYYGLSPGKYTFKVSRLAGDTWSKTAEFSFTINPPWWQTWWAWLLYIVVFGAVIWCFVYYRSKQLIKANRLLEHKIHLRTEEVLQQKEEIEAQRDSLETQRNDLEQAIGELKTTQTQLIQSEKLASLGELTAGIAHEIQNPLNFVNNFSEVNMELSVELKNELSNGNIGEAAALADDIEKNLEKIIHHGKRADAIVKSMLQHSRNNSAEKQLTNINTIADEYFRLSYHGLRAKDKAFNSDMSTAFDENIPTLNVIPQDIGRVLLNLFNNAFYAVQHKKNTLGEGYKPLVKISTALKGKNVEIKVTDNGMGIPDEVKEKIMQPFFTTKPTGEGTGLGLSLSYDIIVKGHGGNIAVDTKENEFTTFTIYLPV